MDCSLLHTATVSATLQVCTVSTRRHVRRSKRTEHGGRVFQPTKLDIGYAHVAFQELQHTICGCRRVLITLGCVSQRSQAERYTLLTIQCPALGITKVVKSFATSAKAERKLPSGEKDASPPIASNGICNFELLICAVKYFSSSKAAPK
jgi:hypothetical protein